MKSEQSCSECQQLKIMRIPSTSTELTLFNIAHNFQNALYLNKPVTKKPPRPCFHSRAEPDFFYGTLILEPRLFLQAIFKRVECKLSLNCHPSLPSFTALCQYHQAKPKGIQHLKTNHLFGCISLQGDKKYSSN